MKEKKNIFDFATKELSQDAFLMWLFENYDCDNESVKFFAYKILNEFNELNMNIGDIEELKTYRQYPCIGENKGKIDIIIKFKYAGDEYLTVIEDKTYSGTHDNQLKKYNETLANAKSPLLSDVDANRIQKIFYKTDIFDAADEKACNDEGWKKYFLNDIKALLDKILAETGKKSTGDEILDSYIDHIHNLFDRTNNVSEDPMSDWSRLDFRTFFYKKVLEDIKDPRITLKNVYDVKYYAYCSFMLYYYLPGTYDRISVEVIFREYSTAVHLMCRVSNYPSTNGLFFDDQEQRSKSEIERLVKDKLLEDDKYFKKGQNREAKKYKTFASESNSMKEKLAYSNKPDDVAAAIKELLIAFMDQCEKISINKA